MLGSALSERRRGKKPETSGARLRLSAERRNGEKFRPDDERLSVARLRLGLG